MFSFDFCGAMSCPQQCLQHQAYNDFRRLTVSSVAIFDRQKPAAPAFALYLLTPGPFRPRQICPFIFDGEQKRAIFFAGHLPLYYASKAEFGKHKVRGAGNTTPWTRRSFSLTVSLSTSFFRCCLTVVTTCCTVHCHQISVCNNILVRTSAAQIEFVARHRITRRLSWLF